MENIDCDFERKDAYIYTNDLIQLENIKSEVDTLNSIGYDAQFVEKANLPFDILGAIVFKNQAQMHARKYCLGLASKLPENTIYEHSKVVKVKKQGDNSYITFCENSASIKSKYVVIASHYPIVDFPRAIFFEDVSR